MGDNRERSSDSRCHLNDVVQANGPKGQNAFVPEDLVVGHAACGRLAVRPAAALARARIRFDAVPSGKKPASNLPQITAGPEANC